MWRNVRITETSNCWRLDWREEGLLEWIEMRMRSSESHWECQVLQIEYERPDWDHIVIWWEGKMKTVWKELWRQRSTDTAVEDDRRSNGEPWHKTWSLRLQKEDTGQELIQAWRRYVSMGFGNFLLFVWHLLENHWNANIMVSYVRN